MASEEEDDYMSDAFLKKLENESKLKSKPKPTSQYIFHNDQPRTRKSDAESVLQEGLEKPIPESNVGFKLLSKMGFDPSQSANKQPIDIVLKKSRTGLGVEETARKQAKLIMESELQKIQSLQEQETVLKDEYRRSKGERFETRKLRGQLIKIRQIEATLREQLGITEEGEEAPQEPPQADPAEIDLSDDLHDDSTKVKSEENDQHALLNQQSNDDEVREGADVYVADKVGENEGGLIEPDYAPILHEKVMQLRSAPFFYCFFCGHRYKNKEDLEQGCPGANESDHD